MPCTRPIAAPHFVSAFLLALALAGCDAAPPPETASTGTTQSPQPVTRGLDSLLIARAYEHAATMPRLYSMIVARHGEVIGEEYFRGPGRDRATNIKSASKSIISALVGIAIAEGHLEDTQQSIVPFFAAQLDSADEARISGITIENLLSMQSGLESTSFGRYGAFVGSRDWVRFVLDRPFVDEPGGRMLYSTGSTHLLSAILTRATGMSTLEYARSRLGHPLGISIPAWTRDPQGVYFGGNEMRLRPRDLLAFGELYRNGGVHGTTRILPEDWIRDSWTRRTSSPYNGHGYGLGWWMRRMRGYDVYFAWGYGGQYVFIVPDLELTAVMTSDPVAPREGSHNRELHRMVADLLIPAAVQGSGAQQDSSAERVGAANQPVGTESAGGHRTS